MWPNIKRIIPDRDDIYYGYKNDTFYLSIYGTTKANLKKNWKTYLPPTLIFFICPLYGIGFIVYHNEKSIPALGAACSFVLMLFIGILWFTIGTRVRLITFFHDHLILSYRYIFGEKIIAKIQRHEVPGLIIKKASDTEDPAIKDVELILPFRGKNYEIISHRTADDFERIQGIFESYRRGKRISDLAYDKSYSPDKIIDEKKYDIYPPISELNRDIKKVTFLFLFHYFCCICGSFLSLPQATLRIARISSLICFLLLLTVVIYGGYISRKHVGKGKDYSVSFSQMPIWLKSIQILTFIWFPMTLLLSVEDFIKATLTKGWPYIDMFEAGTNSLLLSFSFFMFINTINSAYNISELLNFRASKQKTQR